MGSHKKSNGSSKKIQGEKGRGGEKKASRGKTSSQKRSKNQKMGDLPSKRATRAAPFANTRQDVFGDFTVNRRGERKRWASLATCLVTKAIAICSLISPN